MVPINVLGEAKITYDDLHSSQDDSLDHQKFIYDLVVEVVPSSTANLILSMDICQSMC